MLFSPFWVTFLAEIFSFWKERTELDLTSLFFLSPISRSAPISPVNPPEAPTTAPPDFSCVVLSVVLIFPSTSSFPFFMSEPTVAESTFKLPPTSMSILFPAVNPLLSVIFSPSFQIWPPPADAFPFPVTMVLEDTPREPFSPAFAFIFCSLYWSVSLFTVKFPPTFTVAFSSALTLAPFISVCLLERIWRSFAAITEFSFVVLLDSSLS